MMLSEGSPLHSAGIVCAWLAANWGNMDRPEPHIMLSLDMDEFSSLPEEVQNHGSGRVQTRPSAMPRVSVPAGILAKHALGQAIPEADVDD